jgi:beta-mannanase
MMSMNHYGTVNAIGANCVFRRKALDSIGGHAPGLSEDMHTAMQLHAKGWKSVYVPQVFTKGLVPATITAYYKQQLKWARGTLDLLVSVYPKLFKHFTRRQKLHYGILPFHYLSGIIYLINFLIPVVSLFFATTPWKGNVENFAIIFMPVLLSILGIRFYVQRWVMYKSERGTHLIGGLLQSCTWWIYVIGFVYTLFGKKVPYLPTPKDDKERTSWKILVPNLAVGVVSIIAVVYGLSIDFTPFSVFMSGFALLNASFMFYTIFLAYQKPQMVTFNSSRDTKPFNGFDRFKDFVFEAWHKVALPVVIILFAIFTSFQRDIEYVKWKGVAPVVQQKRTINYLGIFAPEDESGISSLKSVREVSDQIGEHFDIVSVYAAWNKNIDANLPGALLDSIYRQKSLAMITWEPWLNSFDGEKNSGKHVFELITEGYFDDFIASFSRKLKAIQRPVFLRFAHEFDNPFYPWFVDTTQNNLFKKAWIHTYEIFKSNGAENVLWIWNPWKSSHVASFYPGKEFVDWIGVDILNYGKQNMDAKWHDFSELYRPFHREFLNLPATPVIISEFGTLNGNHRQETWVANAFDSIPKNYQEIKSVVFFNSKVDKNWPKGLQNRGFLDWTISKHQIVKNSFTTKDVPQYVFSELPVQKRQTPAPSSSGTNPLRKTLYNEVGINLKKGHDWWRDYHVLDRRHLLHDYQQMKELGINTIKIEWNSVYDYNILNLAKEFNFNVSIGFWIPENIDFVNDSLRTNQLKYDILRTIRRFRSNPMITSWNIENDVLYNQKDFYHKPELLFQSLGFLKWLDDLVQKIKAVDPGRPLFVDLEVNRQSITHAKELVAIPGIDALGLVVKSDRYLNQVSEYLEGSQTSFVYSEIPVKILVKMQDSGGTVPFFVTAWQDAHEVNKLTFSGIIDWKGRKKIDYFKLMNFMRRSDIRIDSAQIGILKPAILLYEKLKPDYYAMCYSDSLGWRFGHDVTDVEFEWSLVKCDEYGNFLAIKDIGKGPDISVKIPPDLLRYRLLLTATKGKFMSKRLTTLNTPWQIARKDSVGPDSIRPSAGTLTKK